MAKHGHQTDQAFIIKLTVAQVEIFNAPEISISKDLPCDLVDSSLGEGIPSNFYSLDRPEL